MQIQTTHDRADALASPPRSEVEAADRESPEEAPETRPELRRVSPAVDILEDASELRVVFDVPGVAEDDVELRVARDTLTLTAPDPARGRVYRRAFSLPDTLDPSRVDARLDAGVLTVTLAKRDDLKPRRIPVRSA